MKRAIIYISMAFITLLLSTCTMTVPVTVTIFNTTRISSGQLHVVYGNYEKEYGDGEFYFDNVSFPYVFTISNATECANYIVTAQLDDYSKGTSFGAVLLDTTKGSSAATSIDLMLYTVTVTDDYEPDNDFDHASVIQPGEYQARSLLSSSEVDYVSFYAFMGLYYDVETEIHGGSQTTLTLYDPGHTQLAYDTNSGTNGGSKIVWLAAYTGVCYIKVATSYSYVYYGLSLSSGASAGNELHSALFKYNEWSNRKK
jgi:hypothetical protein